MKSPIHLGLSVLAIVLVTFGGRVLVEVNATTIGFAYLVTILSIAARWGIRESLVASILATLCFNFFFLPPIGTLTIGDPQNWIALFAFLVTSLVASQLSNRAKMRARELASRQVELEQLYALSRAIILTDIDQPIGKQLSREIARIYEIPSVAVYARVHDETHFSGPEDMPDVEVKLRESAMHGTVLRDPRTNITVAAVSLGGQPIGSLALKGASLSESALSAIVNLAAIGIENASGRDAASRAEAARRSEEFKSTLLDSVAHEFKTPLTSIRAAATAILTSGVSEPSYQNELLTVIDQESRRLSALVNEAIHLARVEAGKLQLNRQPCLVPALIDSLLEQEKDNLNGRQLDISLDSDLPSISVDADLLNMALHQLIDNAVKYSPPSSTIRITAGLGTDTVLISVRDWGPGLSEVEQSKIFEKFYRGEDTRRQEQITGSGIGLSIAREILRAHGGDIRVESSPGQGSEFFVSVPLARAESLV